MPFVGSNWPKVEKGHSGGYMGLLGFLKGHPDFYIVLGSVVGLKGE